LIASQSCDTQEVVDPPLIPAVADFEADSLAGIAPHTVHFTDKSSGNPNWHFWSFGDDSTSTEKNPTHIYESPGTYSVTMICRNSQGFVDTLTKADYIEVDNCAVVDFTATPVSGDRPHDVTFTNLALPATGSFLWNFGDGNTSTEKNPVHRYNSCGVFDVTLQVNATCGTRSLTKSDLVTVSAPTQTIPISIPEKGPLWPTKIYGDCEFSGNGPDVWLWANLSLAANDTKLQVEIIMHAMETRSNWSEARGEWVYEVYEAPPGWKITRILTTPVSCQEQYEDTDHAYVENGCTWVTFNSKGDTNGDDICNDTMDDTHVIVTFGTVTVEITEDC
jgi:PKD repeat protein